MEKKFSIFRVISGTCLISGTTIGAGMLGIPLVTAQAGFLPGVIISLLVWAFMLITGLMFLEATLLMPDGANLLSITERFLGKGMKRLSGIMFIFLYYCLLIAYFAAGAPILMDGLSSIGINIPSGYQYAIFGLLFLVIVSIGPKSIDRTCVILTIAMIIAWLLLLGIGSKEVRSSRLLSTHLPIMFYAAPVLFSAFGFHNVIPSLTHYLKRDVKTLRISIVLGTLLPLVVYIIWQWLIIGSVPIEKLNQTLLSGQNVTIALESVTGDGRVILFGRLFAFFAIVTSILGVSFSMVDFIGDGLNLSRKGSMRVILTLMTLLPPFFFASLNPNIFDLALGIAGGYGEAFLNGLLPIFILWVCAYVLKKKLRAPFFANKVLLGILTALSLGVVVVESIVLAKGH